MPKKIIETNQKSEKEILNEGFLKKFIIGALAYGFLKGSYEKKQKHLLAKELDQKKDDTSDVIKKDKQLKKLMNEFAQSSGELYSYVKKRRKKHPGYMNLFNKLQEFY